MTRTQLSQKTKADLLRLARRLGLRGISTVRKPLLIEKILRAQSARQRSRDRSPLATPRPIDPKRRAVRKSPAPARRVKPKARRRRRAVRVTRTAAVASALVTAGPSTTTGGTAGIAAASSASRQLVLLPRDPDWLYACWDFAATELEAAQSQTRDRRLILRVFKANARQACQEITVLPGARDWFIAVHEPDTIFHAELAWRGAGDCWRVLATSRPARTPPRVVAPAGTEQFVQILVDVPFHELARLAGARGAEADQLAYTLHRLQAEGHLRGGLLAPADNWDEDRRQRLAALLQRIQPARGTSGGPFSPPPRRRVSHRQ